MFVPVLLNAQPIRPGSGLDFFILQKKEKKVKLLFLVILPSVALSLKYPWEIKKELTIMFSYD